MSSRPLEDAVYEEIDWFELVTDRSPNQLRAHPRTIHDLLGESLYNFEFLRPPQSEYTFVALGGERIKVIPDASLPRGSWRAEDVIHAGPCTTLGLAV